MTDINFIRNISNINNNLDINSIKKQNIDSKDNTFSKLLKEKCQKNTVSFSKHATERIEERNINVGEGVSSRLNEAIVQAKGKGLKNVLVMIDSTAFIVNTLSNKVITAVNNNELKENIFTNIDGAVIK
ncbi:hypothetical protein JYG23_07585 [Sedimentibacter sp. zth1]|uniref:TIGR02530 family flagellar biosynthesis protein n=1 Tax=Sedimentibacter sp. zth1 TaxID=2816908 RepID=UPI001A9101B5|nr:TIGR02530 family flagellar biosynthesis protein [Sedimentibacter sp. zth1]QSX07196.1 hypothetical protein JYG23_07585 [Sedimentibacter sp. zth1]